MFKKKSKILKFLTTVTPFSKLTALFLFITLPFIAFYFGLNYANRLNDSSVNSNNLNNTDSPYLETYDNKFISFSYSSNLYNWSFGRGVSLDFLQLNSATEETMDLGNRVHITVDIQTLDYTEGKSIGDKRNLLDKSEFKYKILDRKVDGIDALDYERLDDTNTSSERQVWLINNNVKYIFTISIIGNSSKSVNQLKNQYIGDFEEIVNSAILKDVDPIEVDKLGNHPD